MMTSKDIILLCTLLFVIGIKGQSHGDVEIEEEINGEQNSWFMNNRESYFITFINALLIAFAFVSIAALACCVRARRDDVTSLKFMQKNMEIKDENIKLEIDEEAPLNMIDVNQFQYQSFNAMIEDKKFDGYQS